MPTVGWIREGDIERFWKGQPERLPMAPLVFKCPRCGESFQEVRALHEHIRLTHPLELPQLYIFGRPVLKESVLRLPMEAEDVKLLQCTECEIQVDGGSWQRLSPERFVTEFIKVSNSSWNIRLLNERSLDSAVTQEKYHIRFRIPDPAVLDDIDEHFLKALVIDEITHSNLETFHKNLPSDAPAREYAGGLGDLVLGILLKERSSIPRSPMGFDAFEVKMKSSLDVLKPFDRPVALAACGCVRFNLNDFQDYGVATAVEVDKGLRFFRDIAMEYQVAVAEGGDRQIVQDGNQCAICPVDHLTHRLLSACSQLVDGNSISPEDLESLRQIKRGMLPVSQQDRVKIDVICAEGYLRIDREKDAMQHLQDIQFDPTFKDWSQYQMSEKV